MVTIRLPEAGDCPGPWNNMCKGLETREPPAFGEPEAECEAAVIGWFQGGLELYSYQRWVPAAASSGTSSNLVHKRQVLHVQN